MISRALPLAGLLFALLVAGCAGTNDPLDEFDPAAPESALAPIWRRPLPPGPVPREPAPAFADRA
ncbi:MAG TPA: hypothetical protein VGM87_19315 [Roseomonas sp.]|jgi:hypothetical protein